MIHLTTKEAAYIASVPHGLEAAMDYHNLAMTEGSAMGFDVSIHQARYDELKQEHDRLVAEIVVCARGL